MLVPKVIGQELATGKTIFIICIFLKHLFKSSFNTGIVN